jgi:hypothetical protein
LKTIRRSSDTHGHHEGSQNSQEPALPDVRRRARKVKSRQYLQHVQGQAAEINFMGQKNAPLFFFENGEIRKRLFAEEGFPVYEIQLSLSILHV